MPSIGYYVQELSSKCALDVQIKNFALQYVNATGFIIATTCDMNLRSLNLTKSLLKKQSFVVSVINKNKLHELMQYHGASRIKIDESIGTRSSFICIVIIFSMAVFCVFVGAFWGGRSRSAAFHEYLQKLTSNNSGKSQILQYYRR